jgi:hypothetical protein
MTSQTSLPVLLQLLSTDLRKLVEELTALAVIWQGTHSNISGDADYPMAFVDFLNPSS